MAESSRTAALNRMHNAVKELSEQLGAVGQLPHESLSDLKSGIDDVRLRLWGVIMSTSAKDYQDFSESFRLRRAAEILKGILADVEAGRLGLVHKEGAELGIVARELGRRITASHTTGG
jgi:hypothetical protein